MILILNTLEAGAADTIAERVKAKGLSYELVETRGMNISHCIGCNYCWLKNPGVCTIKDDYEVILKKLLKTDQMWLVSDSSYGFITSGAKKLMDRIMPLLLMHLKIEGGVMRHQMRYDQRTDVGVIYRGSGDRALLTDWADRVAKNISSHSRGAFPFEEAEEAVACM